jgi:hypothetical protein
MSVSNWCSNVAVVGGVVAGILVALWFSTVVAMGPAPGRGFAQETPQGNQAQDKQTDTSPAQRSRALTKEQQQGAKKEPECSNDNQSNYYDCLIQLRTARATERQARWAKVATYVAGIALIAAAAAAAAGFWTVWVMRKTAERQLRAYMFVEGMALVDASQLDPIPHESLPGDIHSAPKELIEGVPPKRPRGIPGASWMIKNSGGTPAYDIVHWSEMDVVEAKFENGLIAPEPIAVAPKIFLGPGGWSTKNKWLERVLTEKEMQEIRVGTRAVYVWGRIDYVDAFKKKHTTTYRLKFSNAAYPPIGAPAFTYCQDGNHAD